MGARGMGEAGPDASGTEPTGVRGEGVEAIIGAIAPGSICVGT